MKCRRNNIELRLYSHRAGLFEIVKWEDNPYYGKEADYTKVGDCYAKDGEFGQIHESCFLNPESCYALAFIEKGDVRFVGSRPLGLENIQEMQDFLWLLRKGISKSKRWKE